MPSTTLSVIVEIVCRDTCGAVDLGQVGLHLTGGQALGRQRDDRLVDARTAAAGASRTIFGSKEPSRSRGTSIWTGRTWVSTVLAAVPIREFPPSRGRHVMLVVAQMVGELAVQRGLHQPLGQLGEQTALASQRQPTLAGLPGQPGDQLLINRVQDIGAAGSPPTSSSRSTGCCSGITSVIGCYLHDRSYTVVLQSLRAPTTRHGSAAFCTRSTWTFA